MSQLSGTVTLDGNALANAKVAVVDADASSPGNWTVVGGDVTTSDGSWSVTGLDHGPDRYHALVQLDDGNYYNAKSLPFLSVEAVFQPGPEALSIDPLPPEVGPAIPDSAILHYPFLERTNSTIVEQLESEDATANGTTNVSGDWWEGYAESGDGTDDYIEATTWSNVNFGVSLTSNWGIACTIETTQSSDGSPFGVVEQNANQWSWLTEMGRETSGHLALRMLDRGGSSNVQELETDVAVDDGNKHRIIMGGDGPSAADKTIFVDGNESTNRYIDEGNHSNEWNFVENVMFHDRNLNGSPQGIAFDGVIDNILLLDSKPTDSVAQDDYDAQPWS